LDCNKTPLASEHEKLSAKMGEFSGWLLPLWYPSGQTAEHHATRNACGIFDICHMGEFDIRGSRSLNFLSNLLTNDVARMEDGQAMYHFMLNEQGGVIDDCILYRFEAEHWMLVVNAGNIESDYKWMQKNASGDVVLENLSDHIAKIDLQGPHAPKLLSRLTSTDELAELRFFRFLPDVDVDGMSVLVSRTGYTGEIGFELYTESRFAKDLWRLLLKEGDVLGILPCGLGARDTLRVEAGLPLHGHEIRPEKVAVGHPWEFAIAWDSDFIGKAALVAKKKRETINYILPFQMHGKRKAMPGYTVLENGIEAGTVLSGVISPSLENRPIGFLELNRQAEPGTVLEFRQPGRPNALVGEIGTLPFVSLTSRMKLHKFL